MTSRPDAPRKRPALLTIAIVLMYVSAFGNVALGILVLLSRYDVDDSMVLTVSLLGAAIILFGLLLVAVASGVSRGSHLSRILATIYFGALAALNLVTIVTTSGWDWSAIVSLIIQAFVVVVLWVPPGARHFVDRNAAVPV